MFDKDMKPQLQVITGQSLGHDRQDVIFDLIISKISGNLQLQATTLTGNIKESCNKLIETDNLGNTGN